MKSFFQFVAAIKTMASLAFAAGIMLVTVAFMILGRDVISIGIVWQAIFLALIFGILQLLAFSDKTFPRMRTFGRMLFLSISLLVILAIFALVFKWFPANSIVNWLIFIGAYAAVFTVAAVALRIVFRVGELKYDELLAAYKTRQNN